MKTVSIVACLAFASAVMAQSQQGAFDAKVRRAPTAAERDILDKELSRVISELHFRSAFLSNPTLSQKSEKFETLDKNGGDGDQPSKSGGDSDRTGKCFQAISFLSGFCDKLMQVAAGQQNIPFVTQFLKLMFGIPKSGFKLSEASAATGFQSAFHGGTLGVHALEESFKIMFSYTDLLSDDLIKGPFSSIEQALDTAVACFNTASKVDSKIEEQFNVATCGVYADIYRGVVDEVASKPIDVSTDASEDLKRALSGAQAVVNLSKTSVATANDDLLKTRPIFMADVLDQYREEVNRLATTDDIKNYAQLRLSSVVASSNALEACLHIAADTDGAVEELNEELDAIEDY